ncbi:hypothetical protein ACFLXE_02635 [Chloroflexota bacterium]
MSNATAIRNLAQDMVRAQDERARRIQELQNEVMAIRDGTVALLRSLDKAHSEMSARLRAEMEKWNAGLKTDTADLLRSLDKAHSEMSARLRAEMEKWNAGLKTDTADLLRSLDKAHSEMSARLRAEMEKWNAGLKTDTADLLRSLDKAHSEMSARLQSQLSEARRKRDKEEKQRRNGAEAEARARSVDVSNIQAEAQQVLAEARQMLRRLREDSAEGAAAWKELVGTMHGRRSATAAPPPVGLAVQAREEAPPAEAATPEPAREGNGGLKETIVAMVQGHPEGMKLTEIAEATGEARIKIGNITRMMVNEGMITKDGLFYYPVAPSTE